MADDPQQELNRITHAATAHFNQGNLPQAELICRHILRTYGDNAAAYRLLAAIALAIGAEDFAAEYADKVLQMAPGDPQAEKLHAQAVDRLAPKEARAAAAADTPRYLLIKSWGYGFWSEIDHLLAQLLVAELTGRTPVVHWGDNCLFRDEGVDNAFEQFFEPLSDATVADLAKPSQRFYPPKWTSSNLTKSDINKWDGPFSRVAAIFLLNRDESVAVADFHSFLNDIAPWIRRDHPLFGVSPQDIYRLLWRKYLQVKPDIRVGIDAFARDRLSGKHILAVHVRGSDKLIEAENLAEVHQDYHHRIENYLRRQPDAHIFLLTDSLKVLSDFKQRYAQRLIVTDCKRTDDNEGVHYQKVRSRRQLGIEVITDVLLATRADHFIGHGRTNVSLSVVHGREWLPEEFELIGNNLLFLPNFYAHQR